MASTLFSKPDEKVALIGGVTMLVIVGSLEVFGWKKYVSAFVGRLRVKSLGSSKLNEAEKDATLSHIFIYPVKSLTATPLEEATLDDNGLVDDRRFMPVVPRPTPLLGSFAPGEATHQFITQRQVPTLATIKAVLSSKDDSLTLSSHILPGKKVTIYPKQQISSGTTYKARVWDDSTDVLDMGDEAASFLAEIVAKDSEATPMHSKIRLVAMKDDNDRVASEKYTPTAALSWTGSLPKTGLTDGFPVLIANQASLDELNRRLKEKGKEPIPMSRFRPNIVVTGAKPFAEDNWKIISIGGVIFHLVKGCPRCKQSCTDQDTGKVSEEPLETLSEFRALGPIKENVYFCQNAIAHDAEGQTIKLGAPIHILEQGDPVWDS